MSDPVTIASAIGVALTALGTIYATRTANQAKRGDHTLQLVDRLEKLRAECEGERAESEARVDALREQMVRDREDASIKYTTIRGHLQAVQDEHARCPSTEDYDRLSREVRDARRLVDGLRSDTPPTNPTPDQVRAAKARKET